MSLITGEPPYNDIEMNELASRLAFGTALGLWLASAELTVVFAPVLRRVSILDVVERGAMYFVGLGNGRRFAPDEIASFDSWIWLAHEDTKTVLLRAAEVERRTKSGHVPPEAELTKVIDLQEAARKHILKDMRSRSPLDLVKIKRDTFGLPKRHS